MQTDTWLTDTSHSERCPLCSQSLTTGSNICPACGFVAHEPAHNPASSTRAVGSRRAHPITPIPARASALRTRSTPGGASYRSASSSGTGSRSPSSPERTRGWRHTSSTYEAASSLSSLSLIISETPTAPPRTTRHLVHETRILEHIDEIDTQPPASASAAQRESSVDISELPTAPGSLSRRFDENDAQRLDQLLSELESPATFVRIDEIDTIPQPDRPSARSVAPARNGAVDAASWSANHGTIDSQAARLLAARSSDRRRTQHGFNLLDRVRWWLLRPGRIEFLLWLSGSLLLFGITFLLLLAIVLNLVPQTRGNFPTSAVTSTGTPTPTVSADLRLELSGKTAFAPGSELHLQGQGFHPESQVVFLLDGGWPLLDQRAQAASVQTDASGHFAVDLWLGQGANWSVGTHKLLAREMDNGQQTAIPITIIASPATPAQSNPTPRSTPTSPTYPTATSTLATATPAESPTSTQPASTATPAGSPTAAGTPAGTATSAPGSSSLSNDLKGGNDGSLFARLSHLNPLVWFIGCCYLLSLLFMGLAGVLRRRHR